MKLNQRLEPLMRRIWGRRWSVISRAEYRRHFDTGTVATMTATALLCYGGAIAAIIWSDIQTASAIIRGITWVGWVLAVVWSTLPVQKMFVLDRKLNVTEQWLLTPLPRREILGARAAGSALIGAFMIVLLAPLYIIGAAGLSSAQYPLFAVGHLARIFTFVPAPGGILPTEVMVSVAVAVMAMVNDVTMCVFSSFGALTGALQAVCRKRFWEDINRSFIQTWEITLWSFGTGMLMLAIEGICGAAAGAFCFIAWRKSTFDYAVWGSGLSLAVIVIAVAQRHMLRPFYERLAGRYHDAVLLEDDPGTRQD